MSAPSPNFPPERCPLCGSGNDCAMQRQSATGQAQAPCWCTRAEFSADLLARVPAEARRRACICAACAGQPATLTAPRPAAD